MKSKILYVILCLFCLLLNFSGTVQAQVTTTATPQIEVEGFAEKEVTPDEIYLLITIEERVSGKDKVNVQEQEVKMKDGLKKAGISLEHLWISDASAIFQKSRWHPSEVVSTIQYQLKLSTAQELKTAFEVLDKIGITNAFVQRVHHSKMEEIKKELRIEAIKVAKEKAVYLLEALDCNVGKPLSVRENYSHYPVYKLQRTMEASATAMSGEDFDPLDFRKIKLSSSMQVVFGID